MKSVAEMVKERLDEKRKQEDADSKSLEAYRKAREEQGNELKREVDLALTELSEQLGLKRDGNKIQIGGEWYSVFTELVRGKSRPADDCDEVEYENYVVRWVAAREFNKGHGGHSDAKSFREGFAQFVASRL